MGRIVDLKSYRKRVIDERVCRDLSRVGAVAIEGPRWCGKSWTASYHSGSEFLVGVRGNKSQESSLEDFVDDALTGETPRLIDEWQDVPSLWDAVRRELDERKKPGQFILTGSSAPKDRKPVRGGEGRFERLRMRTMSLYETGDSSGLVSLKALCDGDLTPSDTGRVTPEDLAHYITRGGWPSLVGADPSDKSVSESYVSDLIYGDIRNAGPEYTIRRMELLLRALARNECTTATESTLEKDVFRDTDPGDRAAAAGNRKDMERYLDFFDRMFLFDDTPPFSPMSRSAARERNEPKRHFCDVSLACSLLRLTEEKLVRAERDTLGIFFESLCMHDLKIYAESFGARVYHYRDRDDREIDAVVELADGRWCAFEVKLGESQIGYAAENLLGIRKVMEDSGTEPPSVMCVICGTADRAYRRDDGVFVVPLTALKP